MFGFLKQKKFEPYKEVKSISEAYDFAVKNVINEHREVVTEDGELTWQSNPFTVCITQPWRSDFIHKNSSYGKEFYKKYAHDILNGTESAFIYDYHTRLFEYRKHFFDELISYHVTDDVYNPILNESVDQIQYIINKLKEQPTSRRGIAVTIQPVIDEVRKDIPCLQFVQCWIEDDKLNIYVLFRSEDILGASNPNMYGIHKLQSYIAQNIGCKLGKYYHSITIPHLYYDKNNYELVKWL
jgi:thymidylate synthase